MRDDSLAAEERMAEQPEEVLNLENSTSSKGSTASSYRIKKLRRDHPEIAARLESGEFKSVAAAVRVANGEEACPPRKKPTPLEQLRPEKNAKEEREVLSLAEIGKFCRFAYFNRTLIPLVRGGPAARKCCRHLRGLLRCRDWQTLRSLGRTGENLSVRPCLQARTVRQDVE